VSHPYLLMAIAAFLAWSQWRTAGKLAPKAALDSLVFTITRWPVAVALAVGGAGILLLLLLAALGRGQVSPPDLLRVAWQTLVGGLTFAAVAAGVPFLLLRAGVAPPELALDPGEVLVQERKGRHFLRGENRWGQLLLTNRRIGFRPSRFNVQLSPWSMRLDDIRSVRVEGECLVLIEGQAPTPPEWLVAVDGRKMAEQIDELRRQPEAERRPV